MAYKQFTTLLFITYRNWACLLFGFLATFIVYGIYLCWLKPHIKNKIKIPLKKTRNTLNFAIFLGNLVIVAGSITISLYALGVSERVIKMNPSEKVALAASIYDYIYFFWMMIGILIAICIIWFFQLYTFTKKRNDNNLDKTYRDLEKRIKKWRKERKE